MIPRRTAPRLSGRTRTVRYSAEELAKEGNGVRNLRILHLVPEGGALVAAEEMVQKTPVAANVTSLLDGGLYVYGYAEANKRLYRYSTPLRTTVNYAEAPECLVPYVKEDGTETVYAVCASHIYRVDETRATLVAEGVGGTAAARHYERIYLAAGRDIRYCPPLEPENWGADARDAGTLTLPDSDGGDILALVSFRERLYAFRERAITRVRAFAQGVDFRTEGIPADFGPILAGSVRACGGAVVFLTARGICAYDGSSCRLVREARSSLPFVSPVSCTAAAGKYYVAVTSGEEGCILCYDPASDRSHVVRGASSALVCAGGVAYFRYNNYLVSLSGHGLSRLIPTEPLAEGDFPLSRGWTGTWYLESVKACGAGPFRFEADGAEPFSAEINGGETVRLPRGLIGDSARLRLCGLAADCRIEAIELNFREVTA